MAAPTRNTGAGSACENTGSIGWPCALSRGVVEVGEEDDLFSRLEYVEHIEHLVAGDNEDLTVENGLTGITAETAQNSLGSLTLDFTANRIVRSMGSWLDEGFAADDLIVGQRGFLDRIGRLVAEQAELMRYSGRPGGLRFDHALEQRSEL